MLKPYSPCKYNPVNNYLLSTLPLAIALSISLSSVFAMPAQADSYKPNFQPNTASQQSLSQHNLFQQAKQQIKAKDLANHITWKRLLHYPDDANPNDANNDGKNASRVDNKDFFVTQEQGRVSGANNPRNEMYAMVNALFSDYKQGDASVQCRFPARTYWLKQQLNLSFPQADCQKFNQWMKQHYPKELVMLFAQEHPDNPASAFAHTLLRLDTQDTASLNTKDKKGKKNKQDKFANFLANSFAINYTVDGDRSDNPVAYFVKSSTGKYAGDMTIDPYMEKAEHYLKGRNRDIWAYPLDLTQAEKEQIARHIWEVKDLDRPYYFLTDNCSSEILRLIDVVRPESHLFSTIKYFVIPSEVVRLMNDNHLLKQATYHPAYASVQQSKINIDNDIKHNSYANNYADNNPIDGNKVKRASVAFGQLGEHDYAQLDFRVGYHDILDRPSGYRQNMDMEVLNLKLRAYTDDVNNDSDAQKYQLQELVLIGGRSYNPINTARKGGSWGIDLAGKQVMDASVDFQKANENKALEQQHLVGNIGFEKGISYSFGKANNAYEVPKQLCYAFAGADVQFGQGLTNGYRLGVDSSLGCVYQFSNKLRAKADLAVPFWYHGASDLTNVDTSYLQPVASLGVQYDISKNHAIRLEAEKQISKRVKADTDVQLGWQWHF